MSKYQRKKKTLVIVYAAAMTDKQIQKFTGLRGDQHPPAVLINGVLFNHEQFFVRYNSDIGGKLQK
jgi:hypothetical protein